MMDIEYDHLVDFLKKNSFQTLDFNAFMCLPSRGHLEKEEIAPKNVIETLLIKYRLSLNIENVIKFAVSHFYEIPKNVFDFLDDSVIDSILCHNLLVVESELNLLCFIVGLISSHGER